MPLILNILFRTVQFFGLIVLWIGLQQVMPLVTAVRQSLAAGQWPIPRLCGLLAAVTGPLLIASIMIVLFQLLLSRYSRAQRALAECRDQPWMANPQWAARHLRLSNRPAVVAFVAFMASFLLVFLPLAVASEKTPFLIFAGVAGLFVLIIFRVLWLNRQWNRSELRLSTLPGLIGGPFTGVVILHQSFEKGTVFEATLKCQQTETQRRGESSESRQVTLWSSMLHISKTLDGSAPGTTALPVSFAIPYDCEPTDTENAGEIRWLLSINERDKVSMGGATFEVPVFKTAESRRNFQFDAELIEAFVDKADPLTVLKRYNFVRTSLASGGQRFVFSEYEPSIFYTMIGMVVFFSCVLAAIAYWVTSWQVLFWSSLFPAIFLLLACYGIVSMLFWRCIIETNGQEFGGTIQAQSGIAGFRKTMSVECGPGAHLKCQLDNRAENKEQWSVSLVSEGGDMLKLIPMLRGSGEARIVQEWLAEQLAIATVAPTAEDGFMRQVHA